MEILEGSRWQLISKDSSLNLEEIAEALDLLTTDKVHIDSGKQLLLEAIAHQIHYHQEHPRGGINMKHEVRQWARILTAFCFVEKSRDRSTPMKEKALETELYNLLARLFPKPPVKR